MQNLNPIVAETQAAMMPLTFPSCTTNRTCVVVSVKDGPSAYVEFDCPIDKAAGILYPPISTVCRMSIDDARRHILILAHLVAVAEKWS